MIRINLLAVERTAAKKAARVVISPAHRVTIGASLILIATILGIGWWFLSLRQRSAQIDQDIAKAEAETVQLRSVLAQVQKFEARKAQLTQRVTLIEQLRRGQSAPVHVLDEISKSLPDRLWLTDLKQVGQRLHAQRLCRVAAVAVGLRRQPRGDQVVQAAGGDPRQPGADRREGRRSREVLDQGRAERSRGAAARAAARRRGVEAGERQRHSPSKGSGRRGRKSLQLERSVAADSALKAESDGTDRQTGHPWICRSANFPGGARLAPSSSCAPGRRTGSGTSTSPRCRPTSTSVRRG